MKKILLASAIVFLFGGLVFGQTSQIDPSKIGVDSAQQKLQEISIDKFEDPGAWHAKIPDDHGIIVGRRFEGNPADKKALTAEANANAAGEDKYVYGVKVEYYHRVVTTIAITPERPLAVPGITKTISVWVVGRNFNHKMSVVVEDYFGKRAILPMGTLNFTGWKQLTVAVPASFEQSNPHYQSQSGLKILGFVIDPELTETIGTYYVYLDDLRVVTDLFAEDSRDPDDMADNW